MFKLIVFFVAFSWCSLYAQDTKIIRVEFELGQKNIPFGDNIQLLLKVNGKKYTPLMFTNGFIVPEIINTDTIDVCFIYRNREYWFSSVHIIKFKGTWIFGIKRKFLKGRLNEYYIKFGDETVLTITPYRRRPKS